MLTISSVGTSVKDVGEGVGLHMHDSAWELDASC